MATLQWPHFGPILFPVKAAMPALFAYLIAVGLLLGGGYGALSWLAAPEPVKVVAKVKPKPPSPHEASPEASSSELGSASTGDRDHVASDSNAQPPQSPANVAASEQGAQAEGSTPAQDQQNRSSNADASPAETGQHAKAAPAEDAMQEAKLPAQTVPPVSPNKQQTTASTAADSVAKLVKRQHLRQAHSQKPALALMTLRTIEFPDGRRVTQLIPYRNGERAMDFQPDR
jgi:hypothetical protein